MLKTVYISSLIALVALVGGVSAQQEPAVEFGDLVEVTEVFLDVLATDRKGNVIRGLGPDDFIVEEEGQPVPITSVNFYSTRYHEDGSSANVSETAGEVREVPSSRYFILLFEDQRRRSNPLNRLLQQQIEAGRQAHHWIRDQMAGSDWVAVLSYDAKLVLHQDFTQDRDTLLAAIAEASLAKDPGIPTRSEYRRQIAGSEPSLLRGLPDPVELGKQTPRIYDAVRLVAEAARPIIGRKNLLLFTIGFGEIEGGAFAYARPDPRYYPPMVQALNHANVAVYPIDLVRSDGGRHLQESFLSQLATDSGGVYHRTFVNFMTPLELIAAENVGYYLLSFRSEHPAGEAGYRKISVKTKDKKVRVRTRNGYRYGPS